MTQPSETPRTAAQQERDNTLVSAGQRIREWRDLCQAVESELTTALQRREEDGERKLTKIAQVGNGVFHIGVSERLVIERAEREYEYEQTPERQAARKEKLEQFITDIDAARKKATE